MILRIATRCSQLALWQAEYVKNQLLQLYPDLSIQLVPIKTKGDTHLDLSLAKIGGKGLFIKELEDALFSGVADIAVHSMKDVPAELPNGLILAAYTIRNPEDVWDAFVSKSGLTLSQHPKNFRVGTASLRRQSQLKRLRPDCQCILLRGNVPTRLDKLLNTDNYDTIVLAAAGLARLGLSKYITEVFSAENMLPAVGQGALGIECRGGDEEILKLIAPLDHKNTRLCVQAERAMNARLGGSCQVPIGGYAVLEADCLRLTGRVLDREGRVCLASSIQQAADLPPIDLGEKVAQALLDQGAQSFIDSSRD